MAKSKKTGSGRATTIDSSMLTDPGALVADGREDMIRLAQAVENSGLVDDDMLKAAMGRLVDESAQSLKHALVSMNFANEEDILDAVAADMGMERIDLAGVNFTPELIEEITAKVAERYRVIPVKVTEDEIWLALSDPSNLRAIDDLAHILGKRVNGMIASDDEIDAALKRYYRADDYSEIYEELAESDLPGTRTDYSSIDLEEKQDEDTPAVVKFVDLVFRQAVHERASDIHIESVEAGLEIRFRVDGVLHHVPSPPRRWKNSIISRVKVMAALDLAEKRVPLDGRIKLHISGRKLDLRVSTLPTIFGESIVMRILDAEQTLLGLEEVGFLPDNVKLFNEQIRSPNGIILLTGPTGSGKTTTLYAALAIL
ncbi:Flp pilus assembly complex ATPase component TadA, partial [Candidatus Sumerlaeota bacterium]|nr:Flp pilus assembly complex ATPase component TadA [Candidatus Sumerlaeota bacterium]